MVDQHVQLGYGYPMTTYLMSIFEHLMTILDRLIFGAPVRDPWAAAMRPAGPEVGPLDDDGSFCTGYPTGETARVFVTPNRKVVFPPIDRLEELASGSLGPVDPRMVGRKSDGTAVFR